ncbi:hypothetical protein KO529_01435 [Arenibacter algicola]|uniref:hypothetical protein n=1 Tax=Arenibacter algicola TaxID=616991 RepID=UPI001C06E2D5|nr:hypothetical protein [Arenibacter algicola]MBU2903431.1 hypothetical protein [Arenibacter algicola]
MNKSRILPIVIIINLLFAGCVKYSKQNKDSPLTKINEKWMDEQLVLPLSLERLKDSLPIKNVKPYTIIAFYNGNCSACYLELHKWKKVIPQLSKVNQVEFKFILTGPSKPFLQYNLEEIDFSIDFVFYDKNDEFINHYNYMNSAGYLFSSLLVNRDNDILSIGNPTISNDDLIRFIKLME